MNRSRISTPTKSPKSPKPVEDVEEEFCKRSLQLLTAYYEPLAISEIINFPPVEGIEEPQPEKPMIFNSSVTELRLKRTLENEQNLYQDLNEKYNKRIEELQSMIKNSQMNLDDVFQAEPVDRPSKPLYMANEEKDLEEAERLKRRNMKTLDVLKTEPQMKERLTESEKRGKERAAKRVLRMSNIDVNNMKSPSRMDPVPVRPRKYEPEGGYPVLRNKGKVTPEKKKVLYYQTEED
ncbi:hypothetical protein TVAG_332430 [Trichomonas vaginalis G3]|uniref:Uncharacterized protein n=1 Tax=Trichomonas vaginalis (strain ATCC PRA-98 / G3) TaxID=412133 RepID=A2FAB6_TRIV3|nr:hypothetical protein TVAGG3_0916660 [Trichomonas vaginalis G3]EAX98133.1 hypothetical protein TVAG_332430 [Trichomonas vaginalis G3]KAI5484849.1 hypothetical protein TVAGG3_0916660 [Trichomonas vaginalis G3]|eukprot:XP_001311063.1 hypothetical protein [Trichomonas vaginalis G3]